MIAHNKKINIQKSEQLITSRGGLLSIVSVAKDFGLFEKIKKLFPPKKSNAAYSPEIPIIAFVLTICGGGYTPEDVKQISADKGLLSILGLKRAPGPDMLISFMKEETNLKRLNKVMDYFRIEIIKRTHKDNFIYDIDATVFETEKDCASWCYKEHFATQSLMGFLFDIDLCVSDQYRTGSVHPGKGVKKQLIHTLALLKASNKKMKYLRSDAASHDHSLMKFCDKKDITFLIGIRINSSVQDLINNSIPINDWKPIFNEGQEYTEVDYCQIPFYIKEMDKCIKLIIKRNNKKVGMINYKEYFAFGTNDTELEPLELIKLYNQRGAAENYNKEIKYGFNLDYVPFNKLEHNAVYFALGLLAYNLCIALKQFSLIGKWLNVTVKTLRWKLFNIAAKVVYRSRQFFFHICGVTDEIFFDFRFATIGT